MSDHTASVNAISGKESVKVTQARVLSYRAPRASHGSDLNYVVQLTAQDAGGSDVVGVGEGLPRWRRTGDDAGSSWKFLVEAARHLEGQTLSVTDGAAALSGIRQHMALMRGLAQERAVDDEYKHPFRGTLLGIEMALLDLAARTLEMTVAELLGKARSYIPENQDARNNLRQLIATANPLRQKGIAPDDAADEESSRSESHTTEEKVVEQDPQGSDDFYGGVLVRRGALSSLRHRSTQNLFGSLLGPSDRLVVETRINDARSLRESRKIGDLRAINIRPAQCGGILAALDLANATVAIAPDALISLSGSGQGSRISASATYQLGLALPRVDVTNIAARVEHYLPLTEVADDGGMTTSAEGIADPAVCDNLESGGDEDEVPENDEESEAAEGRNEARVRGDLDVSRLESSGRHGLGVDLSFISMVNDVENMETFPPTPLPEYGGMKPNVFDEVEDLHPLGARGSKGHLAEREALAMGLSTTRFSRGVFTATDGISEPLIFKWNRNPLVSAVALGICTHKEGTRLQLQRAGVPVPPGRTFRQGDVGTAKAFAAHIGYPVVIKPAMGVRGIGVVANIRNEQEFDNAYKLMTESRLGHQDFIVEKHIHGKDYRIVVVGDQVVAAILREPASVVGDGVQTVAELLLNRNSARRKNPHLWARPPKYNAAAEYELEKAGLTIDSIPEPGQVVRLGSTNSLSQGGESIAVLEEMHPSILEACVKIVQSIPGMDYCGVDFLLEDHRMPLEGQDAGVCELNAHAAIGNCQYPMFGTPQPVARIVMQETAKRAGVAIREQPADEIALHVTVRGRLRGSGFERWLRRRAREAGVKGWVRMTGPRSLETVLVGPTVATTAIVSSLIVGPRRAGPTSYDAKHIDSPRVDRFEILAPRRGHWARVLVGRALRLSRRGKRRAIPRISKPGSVGSRL